MPELCTIYGYMRTHATLLGERILQEYPALHQFEDPVSPRIQELLRKPFPAQTIAIMGTAKRWQLARTAMVVAECGTGKTLMSLGEIYVHGGGSPFTTLAMVPPHLVEKWAREAFLTLPGLRVFLIDDLRNGGDENKSHGVNEVRLRQGRIVREGLHTTLSELRLRKDSPSSRKRWLSLCGRPSLFIVGRDIGIHEASKCKGQNAARAGEARLLLATIGGIPCSGITEIVGPAWSSVSSSRVVHYRVFTGRAVVVHNKQPQKISQCNHLGYTDAFLLTLRHVYRRFCLSYLMTLQARVPKWSFP
jgi:hypothetical protein